MSSDVATPVTAGWDPNTYDAFAELRLRPARDLLDRIDLGDPHTVYDLGCGTGAVARLVLERWPTARVTGIDSSPDMLAEARHRLPAATWMVGDIARWRPERAADLIVSNAALHWLDDHGPLLGRLMTVLAAGGVLAVQMPNAFGDPVHTALTATVLDGPWRETLAPCLRGNPVREPAWYADLLTPLASRVDVWETVYHHRLFGTDPVVTWARGAALRPFLSRLSEPEQAAFLAAYRVNVTPGYARGRDGAVLFPFRRLFIVAKR